MKQCWGRHFWAIGYSAFSSGYLTEDMIREYIKGYREHQGHNDDDFPVECAPTFSPFELTSVRGFQSALAETATLNHSLDYGL